MKKNIHFFAAGESIKDSAVHAKIGIRGQRAMELASIGLPILPGFIIDADIVADLEKTDLQDDSKSAMAKIEKIVDKKFGDPANPMLVKIVVSPNMVIVNYPTLHNFGLCDKNLAAFNTFVGENFGYHEMQFLMKGTLEIEAKIAELEKREKDLKAIQDAVKALNKELQEDLDEQARAKSIARLQPLMPKGFFSDPYTQLEIALKRIAHMFKLEEIDDSDTALLIQPMVYGNYGKDSASGQFFTRNIVTGEKRLTGSFFQESFNEIGADKKDINSIQPAYLKQLENVAKTIEDHFREYPLDPVHRRGQAALDHRPTGGDEQIDAIGHPASPRPL